MILKSFALIEKDGHYLLIKEAAKKWKGKWFLPGGKVEKNETPEKAVIREAKEEAGCEISIDGIFYFKYSESLLDHYLAIFYTASIIGTEIKQHADKHSLEARWFTYNEIKALPVRQKLIEILACYDKTKKLPLANFKLQ